MAITSTDAEARFLASSERIARRFPHQPRGHIDEIIRREYAVLADRPIQTYVSNLAEHSTRTQLAREMSSRLHPLPTR